MYFWSNMLDSTLCHHHQTPNEGICFRSMLFIHPYTSRMEKSTEAALEDGSVETREAVCLEMDGFETNRNELFSAAKMSQLCNVIFPQFSAGTTDRLTKGIDSRSSGVTVTSFRSWWSWLSPSEWSLKSYMRWRITMVIIWLLCIQRKICMAHDPLLTFCMGSIKFRSYTMKPSTPALISSSFSLRGGRKQHHSSQHGSIKTWSHIFEYRNRHCNWTLMILSTMCLVNMM